MSAGFLPFLVFAAAIGAGLNAGLFFIFSVCIMAALSRLRAEQGVAAMQSINVVIVNPWFMLAFFGTATLALILGVSGIMNPGPGGFYLLAGGLVFLGGTILVTIIVNVPMNNALAAVKPDSAEAAELWASTYLTDWVRWNHVRTLSSFGALGCFVMAFRSV